jgi:hypothetical protein
MKAQMASLISQMDAQHERMMARLGRTEATDLEAVQGGALGGSHGACLSETCWRTEELA